jgi:hypothetical protein
MAKSENQALEVFELHRRLGAWMPIGQLLSSAYARHTLDSRSFGQDYWKVNYES